MAHSPPDLPGAHTTDSPIDRALTLLLADEGEAALRWAAAVVERDASIPSALVITCRLLEQMGRTEAAIEGFGLAVRRAIDAGNLPLAVAAVGDLRELGDFGSFVDFAWRRIDRGTDQFNLPAVDPRVAERFSGRIESELGDTP